MNHPPTTRVPDQSTRSTALAYDIPSDAETRAALHAVLRTRTGGAA
jgi:hypothetical protein